MADESTTLSREEQELLAKYRALASSEYGLVTTDIGVLMTYAEHQKRDLFVDALGAELTLARQQCVELADDRDALRDRLTELEQDARRLDWLETGPAIALRVREWPGGWLVNYGETATGVTLRDAIDAAMRSAPDTAAVPEAR